MKSPPAFSPEGEIFTKDDGVRGDTSVEALAKLDPVFEAPFGQVTAGNSSQVTDGASWVILASEAAVQKYKLVPRAMIVDSEWSALDPQIMGLAPVLCMTEMLRRNQLQLEQVDLWEINEAFAAQVLACLQAWEDADFCEIRPRPRPGGRIAQQIRGSTWMVGPSALVTRWEPAATGSFCTWSTLCSAWSQARHRQRVHRWRPGRRHADRDVIGETL